MLCCMGFSADGLAQPDMMGWLTVPFNITNHSYRYPHSTSSQNAHQTSYCRCWRSGTFPLCDGSHVKYNKESGDNVGPLLVKKA